MKSNVLKFVLIAIGLVLFAAALYLYRPPAANNHTRVTVTGESQTEMPPDSAVVSFSVITQNAAAVNAQADNARKIAQSSRASPGGKEARCVICGRPSVLT